MKENFKTLFQQLVGMPYRAHWLTTLTSDEVLRGVPSDCSDRSWALCEWCENHGLEYQLVWSLINTPNTLPSLHVALVVDGFVYDTIFNVYEYHLNDYRGVIGTNQTLTLGRWSKTLFDYGCEFIKRFRTNN